MLMDRTDAQQVMSAEEKESATLMDGALVGRTSAHFPTLVISQSKIHVQMIFSVEVKEHAILVSVEVLVVVHLKSNVNSTKA